MADMFPNAAAAGAAADSQDDGKMVDLGIKIDSKACYARNESKSFPMSNLFIGDSRLGCKSDADEQIILHVEFSEFVKVRCLMERFLSSRSCVCISSLSHLFRPDEGADLLLDVQSDDV